ncbi:MAG: GAF domain-containing protein [Proteobacteria bacterium]|nr:MAG: GAF domain-containing protein [Pseudomonadota bacterium]
MSSQARDTLKTQPEMGVDEIQDFIELTAVCGQLQEGSQVDVPDDGIFSLKVDEMTFIFLDAKVWQNPHKIQPFLGKLGEPDLIFVCTGSDEEIENLPNIIDPTHFRSISLPVRKRQLRNALSNVQRVQSVAMNAGKASATVNETNENVKYVLQVSRELNGIRDSKKLLSLILQKARQIANADAGSIYTVEWNDQQETESRIVFKVTQNETVQQELEEFSIRVNDRSIVGSAVVYQKSINIPDLYSLDDDPEKNPFNVKHDKTFDLRTGYQCRSMLTIPMFDISHRVIGVIQLINRRLPDTHTLKDISDFSKSVTEFSTTDIEYAEIVAQQAGIALENALLTQEKEQLFDGFVNAAVTAIEQRDPTTAGHSSRVAALTVGMAQIINKIDTGRFADLRFDKQQLKEIEYASLLHDFGKLGVREQVLTKAKKLYPWEYDILMERFEHIRSRYEIEYLREYIDFLQGKSIVPPGFGEGSFKETYEIKLSELDDFLTFVQKCNEPTVLEQGGFERLKDIHNLTFRDARTRARPFLSDRELQALSVQRGSLTREEFAEIQSHVVHTYEFLKKIPWGRSFPNVPSIAGKHHEKLDGSGYPESELSQDIPTQTRIMTIADIFDALTASDRPYKKAVPVEKALDILEMEVKGQKIDKDLFDLFVESKVYNTVLEK